MTREMLHSLMTYFSSQCNDCPMVDVLENGVPYCFGCDNFAILEDCAYDLELAEGETIDGTIK